MKVLYIGPLRDFSGYAKAARDYVNALDRAGVDIVTRAVRYDMADPGKQYKPTERERELLRKSTRDVDVIIQHVTPNEMRPVDGKVNIAMCAWETDRIPEYWVNKLNKFDAVITFCQDSADAFTNSGVEKPVYVVPHTFDMSLYTLDGVEPLAAPKDPNFLKDRFVFYNISQLSARKGIDVLLKSYFREFYGHNDVILILKTYIGMSNRQNERNQVTNYINSVRTAMRLGDKYPPVMLVTETLTEDQIKKIHAAGDCYVCSSRGEGWGLPAFEALAYGNKLVTTFWGGMREFAPDREGVYEVGYSMEPIFGQQHGDPDLYTSKDLIAEPSILSMGKAMRQAYNDKDLEQTNDLSGFDHSVIGANMASLIHEVFNVKAVVA